MLATPVAIVPQQGIAGAKLGMAPSAVRVRLGTPRSVKRGSNDFGPYQTFVYRQVTITFQSGSATTLTTTALTERTPAGVGVGSTETDVANRVAKARCVGERGFRHCYVGRERPGEVVTDFELRDGRVVRITIARILD